jgi:hypothetical protein
LVCKGPISTPALRPLPMVIFLAFSTSFSMNESAMPSNK